MTDPLGQEPAFPTEPKTQQNMGQWHRGLTKREFFAGMAMMGLISSKLHSLGFNPKDDAKYCFDVADAMLKEAGK